MNRDLWVYLEHDGERLENVSLEILGKGRELADVVQAELVGILLGHGIDPLVEEAIAFGADTVLLVQDPHLAHYTTDAYTGALAELVRQRAPSVLLLGATHNGRDLAGRLAARLRTGLTADAVQIEIDPQGLLRPATAAFGGRILATILCETARPQMATVRPGIFRPLPRDPSRRGQIESVPFPQPFAEARTQVLESSTGQRLDLTRSERMVIAGLGCQGKLQLFQELAQALGADLAVTRPLADKGFVAREYQVGTTGSTVRPKLLIVAGASGAMHFTSGIEEAETIIAINSDPEAPIFELADYAVVGDLFQILPPLIEEVKARRPARAA